MSPLRLPPNASTILERASHGEADTTELDKWLIYTIDSVPASDSKDLYYKATKAYNEVCLRKNESEWEELGFAKVAKKTWWPDLQAVLEWHLGMAGRRLRDSEGRGEEEEEDDVQSYLFGFIALTRPDWREREGGVVAVHCDFDRGKWKVTRCSGIPMEELGLQLSSVGDVDVEFDRVRDENRSDADDNSGPDNVGGPAPVGEWQFAVYCLGIWLSRAERLIPHPRGDPSFPVGEGWLWFYPTVETGKAMGEIQEEWPVAYASAIKDPTIPANGQPNICKRHPELFVFVKGGEEEPSSKIVEMRWDQDVERSEEDLRKIGRKSEVVIRDCEPHAVVPTLEKLANGQQVD